MRRIILIIFFITSSNIALAQSLSISDVDDRVNRLDRDLSILQQQFYRGEGGKFGEAYGIKKDQAGDIDSRLSNLEEQIRYLTGKVEEANHNVSKLQMKLDAFNKDVDFRINELSDKNDILVKQINNIPPQKSSNKKDNTVKNGNKKNAKTDYEKAFSLVKLDKLTDAEKALNEFIKNYDKNDLTGNAYYWLGEIYSKKGNYDNAALNFLYSYKKFPKGNKAPEALHKLTAVLSKLGKKKEACNTIAKLIKEYPKMASTLKTSIEKDKKRLNCQK